MANAIRRQPAPEDRSDAIRQELARVLASPVFKDADRLIRFLKFVVAEALAGRGDRLKEAVIGVEVFDRDAGYDPKIDPIVRVQARRLRSKLEAHYAASGRPGELRIVLPKGGYAPEFLAPQREPDIVAKPGAIGRNTLLVIALAAVAILAVLLLARRSAVKPIGSRLFTAYPGYQNTISKHTGIFSGRTDHRIFLGWTGERQS